MKVIDGILMIGRFSIGWNFHRTRHLRTVALPLAVTFASDRFLVTVGPWTCIYLIG
jgi:hypothetical protein